MEQNNIDNNINYKEIAQEIIRKKELPEYKNYSDKDILISVLKDRTDKISPSPSPVVAEAGGVQNKQGDDRLPDYAQNISPEIKNQAGELVDLALEKGVAAAISSIRRSDPFLIDLFHDILADKILEEIKSKKLI